MKFIHVLPAIFLALGADAAFAADLTKVDRTIAREPVYQSKTPRYCLLVFGPEAKTRVWLVQDGDTLYVDRNGNGDLTEPGERVSAKKGEATDPAEGVFYFEAGEIRDATFVHKNLQLNILKIDYLAGRDEFIKQVLAKNPKTRGCLLGIDVETPGRTGIGIGGRIEQRVFLFDTNGLFQFAERVADAPIVHFGGPLQVSLFGKHKMTAGRETDVVLGVGTPGVGPGTMAWVGYEKLIPGDLHPRIEITYPPAKLGEPLIRELHELKQRC
jgi:hypothetical protein